MKGNIVKVFGAVACMSAFSCAQGMNAVDFQNKDQNTAQEQAEWLAQLQAWQAKWPAELKAEWQAQLQAWQAEQQAEQKYKDEINKQIQKMPVTKRISWLKKEIEKVNEECDRIWRLEGGYDKDQYDQLNAKRNALGNIIGQYRQAEQQAEWQAQQQAQQQVKWAAKQKYKDEINKQIYGKTYDEMMSWLKKRTNEVQEELQNNEDAVQRVQLNAELNALRENAQLQVELRAQQQAKQQAKQQAWQAKQKYKDEINKQIQEIPVTERISWLEKEIEKVNEGCDRIWRPEGGYDKDQYDQLNAKRNALGDIIRQYRQAEQQARQAKQKYKDKINQQIQEIPVTERISWLEKEIEKVNEECDQIWRSEGGYDKDQYDQLNAKRNALIDIIKQYNTLAKWQAEQQAWQAKQKYKDEINKQIQEIPVTERISWLEKEREKVWKECDRIWRLEGGYDKDQYDQLNAKRNALIDIIGQYRQAEQQAKWQAEWHSTAG